MKIKLPEDVNVSLKVMLRGVEPLIWRRLEVPATITLNRLHMVFQDALGWTNSHLHTFLIGDTEYGYEDEDGELDTVDEKGIKLVKVLKHNTPGFWYLYDLGDHWLYDVHVEGWCPPREGKQYPICLDGARKCPPEDCGGVHGYKRMLSVLADRKDPEREEFLTWLGGKYDPEEFDILAINRKLKKYSKATSRA
ncbi:MAG: plasmid pRiA4b ORF-3 family protein [Candidatus Melainabacteria bacterium]|nr:plasmid pRiA4b ORF-3 family protein [Candidatus Melainabacteria bacterium]